jgi:hypothetical protein
MRFVTPKTARISCPSIRMPGAAYQAMANHRAAIPQRPLPWRVRFGVKSGLEISICPAGYTPIHGICNHA